MHKTSLPKSKCNSKSSYDHIIPYLEKKCCFFSGATLRIMCYISYLYTKMQIAFYFVTRAVEPDTLGVQKYCRFFEFFFYLISKLVFFLLKKSLFFFSSLFKLHDF